MLRKLETKLRPAPSAKNFTQQRFFHSPNNYRVLQPNSFKVHGVPEIKVIAIDGSGSSGDFRGKGTKTAMKENILAHMNALDIQVIDPMPPIEEFMGEGKLSHLIKILQWLASNDEKIKNRYAQDPSLLEKDAAAILIRLTSDGLKTIEKFSTPVPGFKQLHTLLKLENLEVVLQTAYGNKEAAVFAKAMSNAGVHFSKIITSSDVRHPRDFPAMLDKIKDLYGVYPWEVLVLGDTPADMRAAHGFWVGGLPWSSSYFREKLNMTLDEERQETLRVAKLLADNGAHYVLTSNYHYMPLHIQVLKVIDDINFRMSQGNFPDAKVELAPPLLKAKL